MAVKVEVEEVEEVEVEASRKSRSALRGTTFTRPLPVSYHNSTYSLNQHNQPGTNQHTTLEHQKHSAFEGFKPQSISWDHQISQLRHVLFLANR